MRQAAFAASERGPESISVNKDQATSPLNARRGDHALLDPSVDRETRDTICVGKLANFYSRGHSGLLSVSTIEDHKSRWNWKEATNRMY
jgi:hypothetical protein